MSAKVRRRLHRQEIDSEGTWAVSYGDMITLLLTFFIMFFTADKFKKEKDTFKIDIADKLASGQNREPSSLPSGMQLEVPSKVAEEFKGKVYTVGKRVIVEFPGVSFFNSGSTVLRNDAGTILGQFYQRYVPFMTHYTLAIRAFTDTKKVRADKHFYKDNLELSALRSVAVMRHLQKTGIPLTYIHLGGFGEMLLTLKDLESVPESKRKSSSIDDLARTVVLVIEPKEVP